MHTPNELVREVRMLEISARYLWPVLRVFVGKGLSARCSRCTGSECYSRIENGVCEACRTAELHPEGGADIGKQEEMQSKLAALLGAQEESETSAGRFDALVLFSGGKDSTYLVHRLRREYPGLRLLAFTVDNNFMSPVALENVRETVSRLDLEHVLYRAPESFSVKMFRYAFTHLNEKGCAGTVDQFDGDAIFDMARNFAADNRIPLVIGGISPIQVEQNVGIEWFETSRETEQSERTHVAGLRLRDIFSEHEMKYWWNGAERSGDELPRVIFPFYAWGYSERDVKAEVVRLGLMSGKNNSPLLTNNQLVPLMALVDNAQFGYSSFEPEFARLVRRGKADRTFWRNLFEMAEYSARTGRFIKKSIDDILRRLELTRGDVGLA